MAAGLVDDLRHPVQVNVLSVETGKALIRSLLHVCRYIAELRSWYLPKEAPSARHVHRCSCVVTPNTDGTKM